MYFFMKTVFSCDKYSLAVELEMVHIVDRLGSEIRTINDIIVKLHTSDRGNHLLDLL